MLMEIESWLLGQWLCKTDAICGPVTVCCKQDLILLVTNNTSTGKQLPLFWTIVVTSSSKAQADFLDGLTWKWRHFIIFSNSAVPQTLHVYFSTDS